MAFIFKYSQRTGTLAAQWEDEVSDTEKQRRCQVLLEQLKRQSAACNQTLLGSYQEVLVERRAKRGRSRYTGRNRAFRKVVFEGSERLLGELVQVRVTQASHHTLEAELL